MKYKDESINIKYKGKEYWFLQREDGTGAVAPLEHCNEKGGIVYFWEDSFAHVYADRRMLRFGQELGKIEDFIIKKLTNK